MRDYKFRGKGDDEETKDRWFYGGYAKLDKTTYCFKEEYDRNPDNTVHYIIFQEMTDWGLPNRHLRASVNPETVGQSTGIFDKNGVEIWEGDIIQYKDLFKGVVKYFDKYAQYVFKDTSNIAAEYEGLGEFDTSAFEVIGNIYDNPELLEKGERK